MNKPPNCDFSNVRNVIAYCDAYKDALNDKEAGFIAQCVETATRFGDGVYFTPRQLRFLHFCKNVCLKAHPLPEEEMSGIARMKARRAALNGRLRSLGKARCRRKGVAPSQVPTIKLTELQAEATEITAKATGWKAEHKRHAEYKGILRHQKPKHT